MEFKSNGWTVVREILDPHLANICFKYFMNKRKVVHHMYLNKIHNESPLLGYWRDIQTPDIYCHYGDFLMDTLLEEVMPIIESKVQMPIIPTYSYARVYEKNSILVRHKDRPSCEISATLNLGGDPWPIYLDPTGQDSVIDIHKNIIKENAPEGVEIILMPGDALIYSGCKYEHWRNPFEGDVCAQVFLHYNKQSGEYGRANLFDGRPMLGYPKL